MTPKLTRVHLKELRRITLKAMITRSPVTAKLSFSGIRGLNERTRTIKSRWPSRWTKSLVSVCKCFLCRQACILTFFVETASTNGNPDQHPLWPIISQAHQPTSSLLEVPTSPDITLDELSNLGDLFAVDEKLSLPPPALVAPASSSVATATATTDIKSRKSNCSFLPKRKRSAPDQPNKQQLIKKQRQVNTPTPFSTVLRFRVWTQDFSSVPREICLDSFTTQNLKVKLAAVLSVHPSRISEILWRKKRTNEQEKISDVLVLVEDTFISEHILDGEDMTVDWEMKVDGNLRLILEF